MRRLFPATAAAIAIAGCLVDIPDRRIEDVRADAGARADVGAPPVDPPPLADATAAIPPDAAPPVVDLLESRGSFEGVTTRCEPFGSFNASNNGDPTAHSGARSCRICREKTGGFTIDGMNIAKPRRGEVYHASAWVRWAEPAPVGGAPIRVTLRTYLNGTAKVQKESSLGPILTTWTKVEVTMDIPDDDAESIDAYVQTNPNVVVHPCFLVDDFIMWRD